MFSLCLLCNLHQKLLCSVGPQQPLCVEDTERLLTTCMLKVVSSLTLRSIKNTGTHIHMSSSQPHRHFQSNPNRCLRIAVSVRDLGMVPYIKIFLDEDQYRGPTLSILEQLAEINPEEFMSTAIGALCSSTQQELRLKRDLLQVRTLHPRRHIQKYSDMQ